MINGRQSGGAGRRVSQSLQLMQCCFPTFLGTDESPGVGERGGGGGLHHRAASFVKPSADLLKFDAVYGRLGVKFCIIFDRTESDSLSNL